MIQQLLIASGFYGPTFLCAADLTQEGEFRTLMARYQRGNLRIYEKKAWTCPSDFHAYIKRFPGVPLTLITKGISAHKWISIHTADPVSEVMGVKVENRKDFLMACFPAADREVCVAVVSRRDSHTPVIEQLGEAKTRIIYHYFADTMLPYLLPLIPDYSPDQTYLLAVPDTTYVWRDGLIPPDDLRGMTISAARYAQCLEIEEKWLPAYAAIVQSFTNPIRYEGMDEIAANRHNLRKNHRWLRSLFWIIMIMSGLLLSNIGARGWLKYRHRERALRFVNSDSLLQTIRENRQIITTLENGLHSLEKVSTISLVADRIAATASEEIVFDEWVFFPEPAQLRKIHESQPGLNPDWIIRGRALSAAALSTFSQELENGEWEIQSTIFASDYDYGSGWYDFTLTGFADQKTPMP
ncbi:MAG: hypothetical protein R3C61_00915 [Bacteroidia bacterium]